MSLWLRMMVNDLKQVMFRVLEDHEDAFVFEDDFNQLDDVRMIQLRAQGHFSDRGLGKARVLNQLALLIGFEPGGVSERGRSPRQNQRD